MNEDKTSLVATVGAVALLIAVLCGVGGLVFTGASLFGISTGTKHLVLAALNKETDPAVTFSMETGCRSDVPHCMTVRTARRNIVPLGTDVLPYVTAAYNKNVADHTAWVMSCMAQRAAFERIERKTIFAMPMTIGLAAHESAGCKHINATNGDGGTGIMQVTNAPYEFKQRAAVMLGIADVKQMDLYDPVQNAAVGMVIWDDCERRTGRRDLAALCYNRGIGAVNTAVRYASPGWQPGDRYPSFGKVFPYINGSVYRTLGPIARRYTAEVLSHMVIAQMVLAGKTPKRLPEGARLTLADIPGWNPEHDGDAFVAP